MAKEEQTAPTYDGPTLRPVQLQALLWRMRAETEQPDRRGGADRPGAPRCRAESPGDRRRGRAADDPGCHRAPHCLALVVGGAHGRGRARRGADPAVGRRARARRTTRGHRPDQPAVPRGHPRSTARRGPCAIRASPSTGSKRPSWPSPRRISSRRIATPGSGATPPPRSSPAAPSISSSDHLCQGSSSALARGAGR